MKEEQKTVRKTNAATIEMSMRTTFEIITQDPTAFMAYCTESSSATRHGHRAIVSFSF